jgi:hypothetical protein
LAVGQGRGNFIHVVPAIGNERRFGLEDFVARAPLLAPKTRKGVAACGVAECDVRMRVDEEDETCSIGTSQYWKSQVRHSICLEQRYLG